MYISTSQQNVTLLVNADKVPSVMTWVNVCDLAAVKEGTLFITDGPHNLGRNQLPPELARKLFFVSYNDLNGFGSIPVEISQVILPDLEVVKYDVRDAYIEVPKGATDYIKSLMLKNPELKFGIGARYVRF